MTDSEENRLKDISTQSHNDSRLVARISNIAFRLGEAFTYSRFRNLWTAAFTSAVGTWMQRVAQDWLVLTVLTDHNASAVGITMALQFGPQLLLLPLTGYAADHVDRRRLIMLTQALGVGEDIQPQLVEGEARPGHIYLLCTDGLTSMLPDRDLERVLEEMIPKGLDSCARALVGTAKQRGGVDNITVVLLGVGNTVALPGDAERDATQAA